MDRIRHEKGDLRTDSIFLDLLKDKEKRDMRGNIELFTLSLELRHLSLSPLSRFEKTDCSHPIPLFMPIGEAPKLGV